MHKGMLVKCVNADVQFPSVMTILHVKVID